MKQCIEDREEGLKFWKHGAIQMDYNHAFYYQIQGQLAITDCEVCIFVVFKETEEEKDGSKSVIHEIETELIYRDRFFWDEMMLPKLNSFFLNCLLLELADPRLARGMNPRSVNFHGEPVQTTVQSKSRSK